MIILIILGLIVTILLLLIRYFIAYARLASHKSYDKAAKNKMREWQKQDPEITCVYCKAIIDTLDDDICPQCGAPYGDNPEWINRNCIEQESIDYEAEESAKEEISKARTEAQRIVKRIKMVIIILLIVLFVLLLLALTGYIFTKNSSYIQSEELNKYSYENYEEVGYELENNGIVYDSDQLLIQVTGIYKDDNDYRVGYKYCNRTDKDMTIHFALTSINGYAKYYNYIYGTLKKNSEVNVYENIYSLGTLGIETIERMQFNRIYATASDCGYLFKSDDYVEIKTSEYKGTEPTISDNNLVYEDDKIQIVVLSRENTGKRTKYEYQIYNKTDCNYSMSCKEAKFNGDKVNVSGNYNEDIPAKSVFINGRINIYNDAYEEIEIDDSDEVTVTFDFKSSQQPEMSFSTGYIKF